MNFIEKYWPGLFLLLLGLCGLGYFLYGKKSITADLTSSTDVHSLGLIPSPVSPNFAKTAILNNGTMGKPIVVMYARPSDPKGDNSLIVQMKTNDSTDFKVGDSVQLSGSLHYPGTYKIWADYNGSNPAVGTVRELYLETKFISNEAGITTVVKA